MPHQTPRPFLVIGSDSFDAGGVGDVGALADVLPALGQRYEFADRWNYDPGLEFDPERHAGLVLLGDDKNSAHHACYSDERRRLKRTLAAGRPVLGICFGAQLLAFVASGGRREVIRQGTDQTTHQGVCEIRLSDDGRGDPVVAAAGDRPEVPMWHMDKFGRPPGATALAWSRNDPWEHCEAFRIGPPEAAVYGLQFHPELTAEQIEGWYPGRWSAAERKWVAADGRRMLAAWVSLASRPPTPGGLKSDGIE